MVVGGPATGQGPSVPVAGPTTRSIRDLPGGQSRWPVAAPQLQTVIGTRVLEPKASYFQGTCVRVPFGDLAPRSASTRSTTPSHRPEASWRPWASRPPRYSAPTGPTSIFPRRSLSKSTWTCTNRRSPRRCRWSRGGARRGIGDSSVRARGSVGGRTVRGLVGAPP